MKVKLLKRVRKKWFVQAYEGKYMLMYKDSFSKEAERCIATEISVLKRLINDARDFSERLIYNDEIINNYRHEVKQLAKNIFSNMKLTIKDTKELLNIEDIMTRGVLVSIVLLRDKDPSLFLAKCKAKINFKKYVKELVWLHKNNYICWSKYKQAIESLKDREIDPKVIEVVEFMNAVWKRSIKPTTDSMTRGIRKQLHSHDVNDLKLVVANRYKVWKGDATMERHLTPTTVFATKHFDKYLEEATRTKEGEGLLNASNLNLNHGDTITYEISQKLTPNDTYSIITYRLNKGVIVGNGISSNKSGKDLALSLKIANNGLKRGVEITEIYKYDIN